MPDLFYGVVSYNDSMLICDACAHADVSQLEFDFAGHAHKIHPSISQYHGWVCNVKGAHCTKKNWKKSIDSLFNFTCRDNKFHVCLDCFKEKTGFCNVPKESWDVPSLFNTNLH